MDSRRWLWSFFLLGALPFLLEATTGCDVVFGLDRVRQDNAVNCECTCDAGAPRSVLIAASAHDVEQIGSTMNLGDGDLDLGSTIVGLRFENLVIPKGATVTNAYVQFVGDNDGENSPTTLKVRAQASTTPAPFTTAADDLSSRPLGMFEVDWTPGAWNNGDVTPAQQTPNLATVLNELITDPAWNDASAIVLRIDGTGQRSAESFEGSDQQPLLFVEVVSSVDGRIPACGAPDLLADGALSAAEATTQCNRVATTLSGMAGSCGYPQPCSCSVVNLEDPNGDPAPDTFDSLVCSDPCSEVQVDGTCSNFDPNGYDRCIAEGKTKAECIVHVSATNAVGGTPICVGSGSPLAFHAFGERSQCEVEGTANIEVGGESPIDQPRAKGLIEVLGGPCSGGSCPIQPYFGLNMDDIEFEVRWHSNPVFGDLVATGASSDPAPIDANGDAVFATDAILGTGAGRRGTNARAIDATNDDPLGLTVDWAGKQCFMDGSLDAAVGNDGACEADDTIPCASDADCAAVGGACLLPDASDEMTIGVNVAGTLVNQPPHAAAGADQSVECTATSGASFTLDGRGSSDPDHNLALASWHEGTRTGPTLGYDLLVSRSLGVGASQSYVLRLVDGFAQTDEDITSVSVVDTTPPVIACNAPATIKPPAALISFGATATDVCDAAVTAQVTSYDCFTFTKKGKRVSKLESCVVSFAGNTLSIADVGGYGDHITWTVEASDDTGNVGRTTCEVVVAK